jgi:SNF2 family DNA or RNA helicase
VTLALYGFQRAGVEFLRRQRRAMLGDDMGLGKTAQVVTACEGLGRVLVVCPNTLKGNWATEIDKWAPGRPVSVLRGPYKKKEKIVRGFEYGFLVINIEAVRVAGYPALIDSLLVAQWDALIVDEAHCIKDRNSQQTRGIAELARKISRVYLLTGTPIMNRVDELWAPLNVLYPSRWPSFWSFVRRNAIAFRGPYGWVIDGKPTRPAELRREITAVFLRREKEEVFPAMPRKVYQQIWLDMEGEQERIYREIEKEAMTRVDATTTVITPGILAQLTRLKQVAVSPGLIGGQPEGVKLDALMDIIRGTQQKMLVFSQFAEAVKLAAGRLRQEDIDHVVFIGETKEEVRDEAIRRFQADPEVRAFLATTQAGGVGLTLTAASLVVFLDKHWTPAVNEQAVDRTRPHMQRQSVQVVELLARNTVDEMIEAVLAGKVSIIEAVIARKKEILPCPNN